MKINEYIKDIEAEQGPVAQGLGATTADKPGEAPDTAIPLVDVNEHIKNHIE